jgi:hypothetical protein
MRPTDASHGGNRQPIDVTRTELSRHAREQRQDEPTVQIITPAAGTKVRAERHAKGACRRP